MQQHQHQHQLQDEQHNTKQQHQHLLQNEQHNTQQQQQQQQFQRLIILNMFALEGYHIAETLQVPCMVAQPYLIPYTLPSGFQRRFNRALPQLAQALQQQTETDQEGQQCVSWRDVSVSP